MTVQKFILFFFSLDVCGVDFGLFLCHTTKQYLDLLQALELLLAVLRDPGSSGY